MNKLRPITDAISKFFSIFKVKHVLSQSAALTYVTLLSFIPFSIFIVFLLPSLTSSTFDTKINDLLMHTFLPNQVDVITESFKSLLNRKISLNVVNILMVLVTSYSLFRVIIRTFDDILNVHDRHKNGFIENLIKFFGTIVFGFLLIFIIYSASSMTILSSYLNLGFLVKYNSFIIPFVLMVIFISLIYFFLPTIEVQKKSIFKAAIITSIFWLLTKLLFNWYVNYLTNLKLIYGFLVAVPIFLIWIYLNWTIILSGVCWISIFEDRYKIFENRDFVRRKITFEIVDDDSEHDKTDLLISKKQLKAVLNEVMQDE